MFGMPGFFSIFTSATEIHTESERAAIVGWSSWLACLAMQLEPHCCYPGASRPCVESHGPSRCCSLQSETWGCRPSRQSLAFARREFDVLSNVGQTVDIFQLLIDDSEGSLALAELRIWVFVFPRAAAPGPPGFWDISRFILATLAINCLLGIRADASVANRA